VARVISFLTDKVNTNFFNFFRLVFNHEWTPIHPNLREAATGDDATTSLSTISYRLSAIRPTSCTPAVRVKPAVANLPLLPPRC
jgi:hypothetical protein